MKTNFLAALALCLAAPLLHAQTITGPGVPGGLSFVDYETFEKLVAEVKAHRAARLLPLDDFLKASKEPNTIILDTRSLKLYESKHLKGAKHLAFADFTQANLAKIIPSFDTRILIYCNNNYTGDPVNFATKDAPSFYPEKPLTLALNIPTYINLYGYGYKNVYELGELVPVDDPRLEFEGWYGRSAPDSAAVQAQATATLILTTPVVSYTGKMASGNFTETGKTGIPMIGSPFVDYDAFERLTAQVKEYRKDRLLNLDDFIAASKDPNTVILDTRADSLYRRKHIKGAVHLEFSDFTQENLAKVIPSGTTRVLIYCNNNFYTPGFPGLSFFPTANFSSDSAILLTNAIIPVDLVSFATKTAFTSLPMIDIAALSVVPSASVVQAITPLPGIEKYKWPGKKKAAGNSRISTAMMSTMAVKMHAEEVAKTKRAMAKAPAVAAAAPAPAPAATTSEKKKPLTLALNIPTFINLYGYGYRSVYEMSELVNVNDPRLEFEGSMVK